MKIIAQTWSQQFSLVALLLCTGAELLATDFAQWRGPLRDGHSPESHLLQDWPKIGPKLLWQVENVGNGYSTPAVAGENIYLISNEGAEERVVALAAKNGQPIWSTPLGKVGHPDQQPNYPGARSTPTIDGKFLFALGSDGDLVCLEITLGKEVWRKNLRKNFQGKYGEWAYSESPLVDGNQVIVTPGGSTATLIALHKETGEVLWKCSVPGETEASYSSVIIAELSGVKQYVQFLGSGLIGVDPQSGKLLWQFEKTAKGSPAVIMTPLASDGLIYSGAYKATSALVKPTSKDGSFRVEEIYAANKLPIGLGGVVKVGDYFYGSSSQSVLCVEFKTGKVQWEDRAIGPCSWLVADQRIYIHAESGEVALIEPSPQGYREKGRFSPPNPPTRGKEKAWAYPAIANGRLYIREQNSLWCYDIRLNK
jgi:outer membrane protein assembly factor BamB